MKSFFKGFINGIKEGFICAFNVFAIIAIMGLVASLIKRTLILLNILTLYKSFNI